MDRPSNFRCLKEYPSGGCKTLWLYTITAIMGHSADVSVVALNDGALYKVYGDVPEVMAELSRQGLAQLEAGKNKILGAGTLMMTWPYYK